MGTKDSSGSVRSPGLVACPLAGKRLALKTVDFLSLGEGEKETLPHLIGRVSWLEAVPKAGHWSLPVIIWQGLDLN